MGALQSLYNKDFVESLLPQKFPFVMVDKLFDYTETSLVSGLEINAGNIFCENGKFLEPGLVEHMAQSVALHTGYQFWLRKEPAPTGYIGSISKIEIIQLPSLGDEIKSTVTILHEFAGITLVNIVTTLKDTEIASGQMKTVLAK